MKLHSFIYQKIKTAFKNTQMCFFLISVKYGKKEQALKIGILYTDTQLNRYRKKDQRRTRFKSG